MGVVQGQRRSWALGRALPFERATVDQRGGRLADVTDTVARITGQHLQIIEDFLDEYRSLFESPTPRQPHSLLPLQGYSYLPEVEQITEDDPGTRGPQTLRPLVVVANHRPHTEAVLQQAVQHRTPGLPGTRRDE